MRIIFDHNRSTSTKPSYKYTIGHGDEAVKIQLEHTQKTPEI